MFPTPRSSAVSGFVATNVSVISGLAEIADEIDRLRAEARGAENDAARDGFDAVFSTRLKTLVPQVIGEISTRGRATGLE
jgi:hypothetical protein